MECGGGTLGDDNIGSEEADGRVGVSDVEEGMGVGGGASVVEELMAARGGVETSWNEAQLADGGIVGAGVGGEDAGEAAGDEAADDAVFSERSSGGGCCGGGGELARLLVGLDLAAKCLGGEEAAVGWSSAGVKQGLKPLCDKREGVGAGGEKASAQTGAVRVARRAA